MPGQPARRREIRTLIASSAAIEAWLELRRKHNCRDRGVALLAAQHNGLDADSWERWYDRIKRGDRMRSNLEKVNILRHLADLPEIPPDYRQPLWRVTHLNNDGKASYRYYVQYGDLAKAVDIFASEGRLVEVAKTDAKWTHADPDEIRAYLTKDTIPDHLHGRRSGYWRGCRCEKCRSAANRYRREWRQRRRRNGQRPS